VTRSPRRIAPARVRGATTAEFAVTFVLFFSLVAGAVEFSRLMLFMGTAVEATRLGARVAVVCDADDGAVKSRMRTLLPTLTDSNIAVSYPGGECTAADCDPVTVSLSGVSMPLMIPLVPLSVPIPDFSTSLPAESLSSFDNAICS
jgi:hypothetical protein